MNNSTETHPIMRLMSPDYPTYNSTVYIVENYRDDEYLYF